MTYPASTRLSPAEIEEVLRDLPPLVTVNRTAEALCVHQRTPRRWLQQERIRAIRAGGRVLIPRAELARFLATGGTA